MPGPVPRLRALDGLRLVAALMVVYFHWLASPGSASAWGRDTSEVLPGLSALAPYGYLGVNLFFVISGFVIALSSTGRTVPQFFRSRVQRLYPGFWAAVVLTVAAVLVLRIDSVVPSIQDVIANLTMLNVPLGVTGVDTVYWTLWAELKFYALFSIVVLLGVTYRNVMTFCVLWTLFTVLFWGDPYTWLIDLTVARYSMFFLVGICLFCLHRYGDHLLTWGVLLVNYALCVQAITNGSPEWGRRVGEDLTSLVGVAIFSVGVGILWMITRGWLDWMSWRWLTTAGLLTYPVYLLHATFGRRLIYLGDQVFGLPDAITLVTSLAALMLISYGVYAAVERPVGKWIGRQLSTLPDHPAR